MIVASEAEEAWWPPTFRPSLLARRWFALWMVQVESHSTLRSSSARKGRRGSCVMRPGRGGVDRDPRQGPTPPQSRCAKLVTRACAVDPPRRSPYFPSTSERVAQPVEHLTFNQEVLGSSPSALTTFLRLVRTAYDEILMENKQEHHSGFTPGFTVSVLASFFSRLDIAASASSRRPPR